MRKNKEITSRLIATALLKTKSTVDYRRLWMELALVVRSLKISEKIIINLDFEIAHHNAIKEELGPDRVVIIGCMFHLLQAVHKWLKKKADSSFINPENVHDYSARKVLDEESCFPPKIWARSKIPVEHSIPIDLTNNISESFNKQLNTLFTRMIKQQFSC
jgi:hypothetical protein